MRSVICSEAPVRRSFSYVWRSSRCAAPPFADRGVNGSSTGACAMRSKSDRGQRWSDPVARPRDCFESEVERHRAEIEHVAHRRLVVPYHLLTHALLDLAHRPGPHQRANPTWRGRRSRRRRTRAARRARRRSWRCSDFVYAAWIPLSLASASPRSGNQRICSNVSLVSGPVVGGYGGDVSMVHAMTWACRRWCEAVVWVRDAHAPGMAAAARRRQRRVRGRDHAVRSWTVIWMRMPSGEGERSSIRQRDHVGYNVQVPSVSPRGILRIRRHNAPTHPDGGRSAHWEQQFDASALLALLFAESGAEAVADAIADGAAICTVNVSEVAAVLVRHEQDPESILLPVREQVAVEPFTAEDALSAAAFYRRRHQAGSHSATERVSPLPGGSTPRR